MVIEIKAREIETYETAKGNKVIDFDEYEDEEFDGTYKKTLH